MASLAWIPFSAMVGVGPHPQIPLAHSYQQETRRARASANTRKISQRLQEHLEETFIKGPT